MSEYEDDLESLEEKYYETESDHERTAVLEEIIRRTDAAGDVHGGFNYRMDLVRHATFSGSQDRALVSFAWCLAQADKNPDDFDVVDLLWPYKWIVSNLHAYPQMPREKIDGLQSDIERRFTEAGLSLRPVHGIRVIDCLLMGDEPAAEEQFELWKKAKRDSMADCKACEQNRLVEYLTIKEDDEAAIKEAKVLFDGKLTCAEVPQLTVAYMVQCYLRTGQVDKIESLKKSWYRPVKNSEEFLEVVAYLLLYAGVKGDFATVVNMIEAHTPWIMRTPNQNRRMVFSLAAALSLTKLGKEESEIKLRMPQEAPCFRSDGKYAAAELANWFEQDAMDLAARFDKRNGNDYVSRSIEKKRQLFESSSDRL